jgi:hypothetical protein
VENNIKIEVEINFEAWNSRKNKKEKKRSNVLRAYS